MLKVIMFNGPKDVGKTSIAERIAISRCDTIICPIMDVVKVAAVMDFFSDDFSVREKLLKHATTIVNKWETDGTKDELVWTGANVTPRDLYIKKSEQMRREHGELAVVKAWHREASKIIDARRAVPKYPKLRYMIVPDVRYTYEANYACSMHGHKHCSLVQIRRPNKDFFNDVGFYIENAACNIRSFDNDLRGMEFVSKEINKALFK